MRGRWAGLVLGRFRQGLVSPWLLNGSAALLAWVRAGEGLRQGFVPVLHALCESELV